MKLRHKKIAGFAAAAALSLSALAGASAPARGAALSCAPNDFNCSPGPGWNRVLIKHVSSGMCIMTLGDNLDRAFVTLCTHLYNGEYWWTRLIDNGARRQFTEIGNDANFHNLGFSGGYFKLEPASDSVYLVPWDSSNGAWTYANSAIQFFAGDPGCGECDILSDIDPLTHWLLVSI